MSAKFSIWHRSIIFIALICFCLTLPQSLAARTVRVGVFPAAPLVLIIDGKPAGLFIDLIEHFSKTLDWRIQYVEGVWSELLISLENGDIDLLPAVGYSSERASKYDFSTNPVYIDNGVLFTRLNYPLHTIFDLQGKRVAAVKGSIFTKGFIQYIESFGVQCTIILTEDNRAVMQAIISDKADVGVSIYSLGNDLMREFPVAITPISFSPVALEFAVPKGKNADLISDINRLMAVMINDPDSLYSQSFLKWTKPPIESKLPNWVWWGIPVVLILGFFLALWNFLLKQKVALKTKHLEMEISEHKESEMKLQKTIGLLNAITETSTDAISVKDTSGRYLLFNKESARLTGKKPIEVIGNDDTVLFPIDEAKKIMEADQKIMASGQVVTCEDVSTTMNGIITLLSTKGAIYDESGKNIGIFCISRDITDRVNNEKTRLKVKNLESLGVLAGGIAHDFNNILMGLFGNMELAREMCLNGDHAEILASLESSMTMFNRAKALAGQLLTFAKGGKPVLAPADIGYVIKVNSRFALSGSSISLELDIPDDLWPCMIDKHQIGQVINNLAINAMQAMQTGGKLYISAENIESQTGNYVCVTVKDCGAGIQPENLTKIFDPYFTTKQQGSGLGLSVVHSIIEKHKGTIEVTSVVGMGTTFTIHLPAIHSEIVSEIRVEKEQFRFSGRVLIMDDETGLLGIFKEFFKKIGADSVGVVNGQEAVAAFQTALANKTPFAVVILDLTIPGGLGGREIILELRKISSNFFAIASSGYSNDPVIAAPKNYSFDASIQKPFSLKELEKLFKNEIA